MICNNCKKEIKNNSKFCKYCGNMIETEQEISTNQCSKNSQKQNTDLYEKLRISSVVLSALLALTYFIPWFKLESSILDMLSFFLEDVESSYGISPHNIVQLLNDIKQLAFFIDIPTELNLVYLLLLIPILWGITSVLYLLKKDKSAKIIQLVASTITLGFVGVGYYAIAKLAKESGAEIENILSITGYGLILVVVAIAINLWMLVKKKGTNLSYLVPSFAALGLVFIYMLSRLFTVDIEFSNVFIGFRSIDYYMHDVGFLRNNFSSASAIWFFKYLINLGPTLFFVMISYFAVFKNQGLQSEGTKQTLTITSLISMVLVLIFNIIPTIIAGIMSVKDYRLINGVLKSPGVGLKNYFNVLEYIKGNRFIESGLSLNIKVIMITLILSLIVAISVTLVGNKKIIASCLFLSLIPVVIPTSILANIFLNDTTNPNSLYVFIYVMKYSGIIVSIASMFKIYTLNETKINSIIANIILGLYSAACTFIVCKLIIVSLGQTSTLAQVSSKLSISFIKLLAVSIIIALISMVIAFIMSYPLVVKTKVRGVYIVLLILALTGNNPGVQQFLFVQKFNMLDSYLSYFIPNIISIGAAFILAFSFIAQNKAKDEKFKNELNLKTYFRDVFKPFLILTIIKIASIWSDSYTSIIMIHSNDKKHPWDIMEWVLNAETYGKYGLIYGIIPVILLGLGALIIIPKIKSEKKHIAVPEDVNNQSAQIS